MNKDWMLLTVAGIRGECYKHVYIRLKAIKSCVNQNWMRLALVWLKAECY